MREKSKKRPNNSKFPKTGSSKTNSSRAGSTKAGPAEAGRTRRPRRPSRDDAAGDRPPRKQTVSRRSTDDRPSRARNDRGEERTELKTRRPVGGARKSFRKSQGDRPSRGSSSRDSGSRSSTGETRRRDGAENDSEQASYIRRLSGERPLKRAKPGRSRRKIVHKEKTPPTKIKSRSDTIRLQKFLAECGLGSRRKTELLIVEGRVQVNGKVVNELGSKVNPFTDRVEVNRKPVKLAPKGIMLLNKPRGVVSTLSDPEGRPTIADFLTKQYRSYFPVGRLDWDSTGLMLLTNDGDLAELLMHPRYQFDRVYHARVEGSVSEDLLKKFEKGVKLRDGLAFGVARVVGNNDATTWVEIRVREGRNRLVRRMFDEIGHSVVKLKRVEYGPFRLGKLDVGQMRHLTEKEYFQVRNKVFDEVEAPKTELNSQAIEKERFVKKKTKKKVRTRLD